MDPIDFSDTKIAFAHRSDRELRQTARLFGMMNHPKLVDIGARLGVMAIHAGLPFIKTLVRNTIYKQFVGGTTLLNSEPVIEKLWENSVATILDYGVEARQNESDFNQTMNENIRALDFASRNDAVPVVSTKITGLARFGLLEKIQSGNPLSEDEKQEFMQVRKRLDAICHAASERNLSVFFDAEESWIQDTLDNLIVTMMERYNLERPVVYNTFQLYRHDRLAYLKASFQEAQQKGFKLGAKLVRGAYQDKERERATEYRYQDPIQPDKPSTDRDFNAAIRFCIDHHQEIGLCNATHNAESCQIMVRLIEERNLPKDHPNLNFSQLLGMSDNLTFHLAARGYNVAKYMPYGPVRDVLPYLVRRAQENSSVTGDMSREYNLVQRELQRRRKEKS